MWNSISTNDKIEISFLELGFHVFKIYIAFDLKVVEFPAQSIFMSPNYSFI